MAYPYNGILLRNKKKPTIDIYYDVDETQNIYSEWKRPDSPLQKKRYTLYNSIYIEF